MSEITGIWLHRDGDRIAIERDRWPMLTVLDTSRRVHPDGAPAAELTPRAGLDTREWAQMPLPSGVLWSDPHDFEDRITDPPPETR